MGRFFPLRSSVAPYRSTGSRSPATGTKAKRYTTLASDTSRVPLNVLPRPMSGHYIVTYRLLYLYLNLMLGSLADAFLAAHSPPLENVILVNLPP